MGSEQPIIADVEGPIRHKLTVEEFLILDEAGVFGDDQVELIDGEILTLSPVYKPHAEVLAALTFAVFGAVRRLGGLRCYTPVSTRIDDVNLPQPDLVVAVHEKGGRYVSRDAVRLIVEVSSSTLRHDLIRKAALFAGAGIPEYWVFDVTGRTFVRMNDPAERGYAAMHRGTFGESLVSATIAGLVVETASFLDLLD